ncbi:hypothetical protein JG688_00002758 [Phytophthora aleatoria]|uniref:ATP-dependent helicase CHD1-2/hrp3 HTH domain-containing protein n=1 Tax=Phytophthora aleatoria TaxID=2496075 RepID=A0A8J5IV36_9STRA|nr:hypothetical protein JG688_00002758 [Phytophthora aleatoria]
MAENPQETHIQDQEEDKADNSSSDDDSSSSSSGSSSSSSSSDSESEDEPETENANAGTDANSTATHATPPGGINSRAGHGFPSNSSGPALSAPRPHGLAANTETLNVNSTRAAARFKATEREAMMPLGTRKRDRRTIEEIQRDLRDKRKKPLGTPAAKSSPPPPKAANFADEYKMPSFIERSNLLTTTKISIDRLHTLANEVAQKAKQAVEARPPHDNIKIAEVEAKSSQVIERLYENLKLRVAVQRALRTAGCTSGNAQANAQGAYVLVAKQSDLSVLGVNTRDLPSWTWAEKEHDWTQRKDAALLLGVYVHGFGGWEDILNDDLLHFQNQRALKGERLKKRAENLLKRLPPPDLDAGDPRIVQQASSLSSAGANSNQSLGAQFSAIIHSGAIAGVTASIPANSVTGGGRMARAAERFAARQQNGEDMSRRHVGSNNGARTSNGQGVDSGRQQRTPPMRSPAQVSVVDNEPEEGEIGGASPAQSRHKRRSSSLEDENQTTSRKKHRNNSIESSSKKEKRKKERRRSDRSEAKINETPAVVANSVADVAPLPLLSAEECYEKWKPNKKLREIRQVLKKMKIMAEWSRNQKDETVVEKVFKYVSSIGEAIDRIVTQHQDKTGDHHSDASSREVDELCTCNLSPKSKLMLAVLQPPPTAEELALKEQVTQMLTSQGVLAKVKAELRAAVFEVMHEREGFVKTNDAPKLSDFPMETRTTALSLIVECMQFFHWEHALRVLLAETNAENEQHDSALLAKKLGLTSPRSSHKPTLFQLIESKVGSADQSTVSARTLASSEHNDFDEEDEDEFRQQTNVPERNTKPWKQAEEVVQQPTLREIEKTEPVTKNEAKGEYDESSAEIEESMAEEVPSGSELEESNSTNYGDEGSQDQSAASTKQTTGKLQHEAEDDDKALEDSHEKDKSESDDENAMSLQAPPPAPAKLPAMPPLVAAPINVVAGDADDDFDAEEEAERLRKLDAALQAMEAEDDTGTLQQLKASLQMELQEQDSFVSSGEPGKAEESDGQDEESEVETSNGHKEEDDDGYGSSDFEEEEEIASEISEEMESMPELSDKEDESEDGAAVSAADAEPPQVLRNDTRVDSEDALNSYDYIEDVEKGGW